MRINNPIKTVELLDFEKKLQCEHGISSELVINMRRDPKLPLYYVQFERCEVSEGRLLTTYSGDGNTITKALRDYAKQISNKRLVFNAFDKSDRREITSPKLKHTKSVKHWRKYINQ